MLISHRKRFIYTKTAKTAGTSIESYFEQYCFPEGLWKPSHRRESLEMDSGVVGFRGPNVPRGVEWFHHMGAEEIRAKIGTSLWSSYFKFCVVRDPFDKAVSAFFHHRKRLETRSGLGGGLRALRGAFHRVVKGRRKGSPLSCEFEAWLESGGMVLDRDKYVIDGEFCLDGVIRYERLLEDVQEVCTRIGVAYEPDRMPRYKSGFRDVSIGLEDIYTARSIEIVSDLYCYEMERFGYKAPKCPNR